MYGFLLGLLLVIIVTFYLEAEGILIESDLKS